MKFIATLSLCSLMALSSLAFAADQNCEKLTDTPIKACECILNNAFNHGDRKYSKKFLDNAFKNYPSIARANCENTGGDPARCNWSVDYYDNNNAPNDSPPVVKRSEGQCPSPT